MGNNILIKCNIYLDFRWGDPYSTVLQSTALPSESGTFRPDSAFTNLFIQLAVWSMDASIKIVDNQVHYNITAFTHIVIQKHTKQYITFEPNYQSASSAVIK